jgi:hypothetical protein
MSTFHHPAAVLLVLVMTSSTLAQTIERVTPFLRHDEVRIQVSLKSDAPAAGVEVAATIEPLPEGPALWKGSIGELNLKAGASGQVERTVKPGKPRLWDVATPNLYQLTVTATRGGKVTDTKSVRIGFRSFDSRGGQFLLNGRPIFLRGIAINPPGRGIPADVGSTRKFAQDYVRYMKSRGVNLIRLEPGSQEWFDVCDEMGMLVFQGAYGAPPTKPGQRQSTKSAPPEDFESSIAGYQAMFEQYAAHPSIVIYIMSNELPYQGTRGKQWHAYLTKAHARLKQWAPKQLFIGNAGYGEGREGDINDVHRYWGWYYNTFLTYYNLRNTQKLFGDPQKVQPFTFSECVGNYTGVDGSYNIVLSKQMGAALHWTGHAAHADQQRDALEYQRFMTKQAAELFRRLRPQNRRLAGLMPFTILFHHWKGIESFDQMVPKPAMEQLGRSYAPVLLSWEMWTPQVYAGTTVKAFAHVVNDADDGAALKGATLEYEVKAEKTIARGTVSIPEVPYFGTWKTPIEIALPADAPQDDYTIIGRIKQGDREITINNCNLFIASNEWKKELPPAKASIALHDPKGKTARALKTLGIHFRTASAPAASNMDLFIIGEAAWSNDLPVAALRKFVSEGGRVLVLGQDHRTFKHDWLPAKIEPFTVSANDPDYVPEARPSRDQMHINPERPWHPVFSGLDRYRLRLWSDYTGWDETRNGFPAIYPVTYGFRLTDPADLKHTAILANYDRGLEGVALCEMFDGKGSVIVSAFDLVDRVGLDPAADRLLGSLVAYAASSSEHELHLLIEKPIVWGDYPTERGVITGPLNGLVVNAVWQKPPTDPNAVPLPDNTGAWNTDPGNAFIPDGRRPLGPFGYSTASSLRQGEPDSLMGSGIFHCRVPDGRRTMKTTVRNNGPAPATLKVEINSASASPETVPPGETVIITTPLPDDARGALSIRYSGHKTIVLEETAFE